MIETKKGVLKSLRAFQNPFFTGKVVTENGNCRAGFLRKQSRFGKRARPLSHRFAMPERARTLTSKSSMMERVRPLPFSFLCLLS